MCSLFFCRLAPSAPHVARRKRKKTSQEIQQPVLTGGEVLVEGLGSAPSSTEPASIVRWVAPPANKPKPPPRAKLVAARPVFGFALPRRACICTEQAVTAPSATRALPNIEFLSPPRKLCAGKQTFSSLLNAGALHRFVLATSHCGSALAANGRTARGRTALVPLAKRHLWLFDLALWLASERIRFS